MRYTCNSLLRPSTHFTASAFTLAESSSVERSPSTQNAHAGSTVVPISPKRFLKAAHSQAPSLRAQ